MMRDLPRGLKSKSLGLMRKGGNRVSDEMNFQYYYGAEAEQFTFYRIPKLLITDGFFRELSSDAKILYGLMLDRMSLSIKNGWIDEQKRAYIYFSLEDAMEYLNIGRNKALKIMAELDTETGIGLIERRKQGQGKISKIYVKKFIKRTSETTGTVASEEEKASPEVYNLNFMKFKNQTSKSPEFKLLEVYKSNPNKNKENDNKYNDNKTESDLILSDDQGCDEMDIRQSVRKNVELEELVKRYPLDQELIGGIYELIVETLLGKSEVLVISGSRYPAEFVKNKLWRLRMDHVEYVLKCLKENTTKVRNIRKYMLAALFNAPTTIDGYYQAEVNHDLAWGTINIS